MSTISIKLNLRQLKHVITKTKKGTKCLLIPISENDLFEGEKGIYLDITAWELKTKNDGKDTHILKQSFLKEKYESMSKEEKESLPIFGAAKVWNGQNEPAPQIISSENLEIENSEDLPF